MIFAFTLTLLAGLATCLGGLLTFVLKRNNDQVLGVALGFSAGAMLYISVAEIVPKAWEQMPGGTVSWQLLGLSILAGLILIWLLDLLFEKVLIPKRGKQESRLENVVDSGLLKLGWFTALILTAHNFPEGFATFLAGIESTDFAISLAVAIGLHNIPEGVAVAAPLYYATGSRMQAMLIATVSGLSEPLGAIVGYLLINTLAPGNSFAFLFAAVAGAMIYISLVELLPTAFKTTKLSKLLLSVVFGAVFMAVSLILL